MTDTICQYLTFSVDGQTYALPVPVVREVIECGEITRVPTLPRAVRGVINLRGTVIPVMDLAIRFGRSATPVTPTTCIVVVDAEVDGEPTAAGLLVDSVNQVVDELALEPAPHFGTAVPADLLAGVAQLRAGVAHVLALGRVLDLGEVGAGARQAVTAP
ncbi:MAG TPA: chemotaxis protein CheW [Polyangia bacterium]|jgi:purine-binding chemotaxis protein CheW